MEQNLMNGYILALLLLCNRVHLQQVTNENAENTEGLKEWSFDVYTGRQFDDIVLPSTSMDNIVFKPAILVMYGPKCEEQAMQLKNQLRPGGPPSKYLTVAFHDYVTNPRHIWYELDEIDDLYSRYMTLDDNCFKLLFFPTGARLSTPEERDGLIDPFEWIWAKVSIMLTIVNNLDSDIIVKYVYDEAAQYQQGYDAGYKEGYEAAYREKYKGQESVNQEEHTNFQDESQYAETPDESDDENTADAMLAEILATDSEQISVGVALVLGIYASSNSSLLYYKLIEPHLNFTSIVLNLELLSEFRKTFQPSFYEDIDKQLSEESEKIEEHQHSVAVVLNHAFVQPVLFQKYTETGYKKIKIPSSVYQILMQFYNTSSHLRQSEQQDSINPEPVVNYNDVKTTAIHLTESIKWQVSKVLQPIMEEWSKTKLRLTSFYGIREYYKGNKLRSHTDIADTHVISAILMIHQVLNNAKPWPLEVIDYTGHHQHVTLEPGEMLLYESATLIHGRPTPFQGEIFANCYIHYQPIKGWKWRFIEEEDLVTNDEGVTERNNVINAPFMLRPEFRMPRDEL